MLYYGILGGWVKDLGEELGDFISSASTSVLPEVTKTLPGVLGEEVSRVLADTTAEHFNQMFMDAFNPIEAMTAKFKLGFIEQVKKFGDEISKSWDKVDQAAFNFGKQIGLTQTQVESFREDIIKLGTDVEGFGAKYGKTLDELIKLQADFSSQMTRAVRLTNEQFEDLAAISGLVGDEMTTKFAAQLDSFGMSTTAAGEMMTQMYNESMKKGITLQAYSKNVVENLHLAQQYTFKDGVSGLMKMAENAAKMKMDMEQVVSLGNKLSDGGIDSAVNMAAELQVLGGAFAQFADPLGLLHDSLLDMNGLSERVTKLVGQMGRFDKNEGRVIIDPFQQMQLRQAAKSMGMDYGKLIESANQQAKRKEIEAQMRGADNISEEYKELILNTAQFKNGRAGVTINGKFKDVSLLTGDDLSKLADLEKDVGADVKDIKKHLIGAEEVKQNTEKELENQKTIQFKSQSEAVKGIYTKVAESSETLQEIARLQMITSTLSAGQGIMQLLGPFLGPLKSVFKFLGKKNGGMIIPHSDGDFITNGIPGKEFVLNSAQYGEFIVNKEAAQHHISELKAINADKHGQVRFRRHDEGGILGGDMMPSGSNLIMSMYALRGMGALGDGINKITYGSDSNVRLSNMLHKQDAYIQTMQQQSSALYKKYEHQLHLSNNLLLKDSTRAKAQKMANENLTKMNHLQSRIGNAQQRQTEIFSKIEKINNMNTMMHRMKNVGGSALMGVGSYFSAKAQYKATGEAIMEKQKAEAGSVGAGIGAAAGAALGTFAGPIGMMIGGAVGQWVGKEVGEMIGDESDISMSDTRTRLGKEIDNPVGSNKFLRIKGSFYSAEQEALAKALSDGKLYEDEIDSDLVEKLKQYGNGNIIEEEHGNGIRFKGLPHTSGGIVLGYDGNGHKHIVENNEVLLPKNVVEKSDSLITGMMDGRFDDSSIKSTEPMGKQLKVNENNHQNSDIQTVKMEPIEIIINGSLKLDAGSAGNENIIDVLKNNTFIGGLVDLIAKGLNEQTNFGVNRKDLRNKYV